MLLNPPCNTYFVFIFARLREGGKHPITHGVSSTVWNDYHFESGEFAMPALLIISTAERASHKLELLDVLQEAQPAMAKLLRCPHKLWLTCPARNRMHP